jgi:hypothetical protein
MIDRYLNIEYEYPWGTADMCHSVTHMITCESRVCAGVCAAALTEDK